MTLEQIRGREGYRVRNAYRQAAERFNVKWEGRQYDPGNWNAADPLNRALSAANACLHGMTHAAILTAGLLAGHRLHPHRQGTLVRLRHCRSVQGGADRAAGFRGHRRSSDTTWSNGARQECREVFQNTRLLERILPDIEEVLAWLC